MSKLALSCPFFTVGPGSIIPHGSISLPVTFGMPKNYHTKSVFFDIAKVNIPFNAILGKTTLY
jgi:hypothetical protein